MKILVVNPNTSRSMTDTIARTARRAARTSRFRIPRRARRGSSTEQRPVPPPANALTIEKAIQIALDRNYDLQRSEYQAATAEQNLVLARSIVLPQLSFNGSVLKIRQGQGTQVVGGVPITVDAHVFTQYRIIAEDDIRIVRIRRR